MSACLAEQGDPHRRGKGTYDGLLMGSFADRPVTEVTTREVTDYLRSLDHTGKLERTVNKHRQGALRDLQLRAA